MFMFISQNLDGSALRIWVTLDGEAIILNELFEQEVLDIFAQQNIDVGKVPGGTTAINQASDAAPVFRACKKGMDTVTKNETDVSDPELAATIYAHIVELERRRSTDSKKLKLTPSHKKKIIYGIERIVYVLKNYLKLQHIADGFEISGQHPVSFEKVMNQCYTKLHSEDYEVMKQNAEQHIDSFRLTGRLTNDVMDEAGIWKCDGFTSRDDRALSYQGAVLVTSKDTIQRYVNYKQIQEDNHNPAIIAQRKELAKALKMLAANEAILAERERKDAAAVLKAEAVRLEKHRVSLLTAAQKKAEALAKATARKKNKEQKEQDRLDSVKAARLVVERDRSNHHSTNNDSNSNNSSNTSAWLQEEEEEGDDNAVHEEVEEAEEDEDTM